MRTIVRINVNIGALGLGPVSGVPRDPSAGKIVILMIIITTCYCEHS